MGFFPHDLVGWLTVIGSISGAMWFVIKYTFVKSMDSLNDTIRELKDSLKGYDRRLDDLDKRTTVLEDWRVHHDDNE